MSKAASEKPPILEDVGALERRRDCAGLKVDEHELRARVPRAEAVPLLDHDGAARAAGGAGVVASQPEVRPGLVVGHEDDEVGGLAARVEPPERRSARGPAARERREDLGIRDDRVERVQPPRERQRHDVVREREHRGALALAEERGRHQGGDVDAADVGGRGPSMAGDRRVHRSGHIRTERDGPSSVAWNVPSRMPVTAYCTSARSFSPENVCAGPPASSMAMG